MRRNRLFFILVPLLIIALGLFMPDNNMKNLTLGALVVITLIVLDIKMPVIANLSKDNPKVKTMRRLNRGIILIILGILVFVLTPIKSSFSSKTNEIIGAGLISLFIMIFGNASPKIPFNRNVGLRLPWTVRDEETWKMAHRNLGYVSFPIAILQFVLVFFFSLNIIAPVCIISWVLIPSVYSLWFFYKKFKDFNRLG